MVTANQKYCAVADGMGGAASGEIASREGLASLAVNLFGHWGRYPAAKAVERKNTGQVHKDLGSTIYSRNQNSAAAKGRTVTSV